MRHLAHSTGMTLLAGCTRIAALCVVLYLMALAWVWFRQEKLLFAPTVLAADYPLATAPDMHEVAVDVPGVRLPALHLKQPNAKGVVFFLHGNGGSLESWFVNPESLGWPPKWAAHNDLQNFDTYLDLYAKALVKL